MVLNKWKDANRELRPLDMAHARAISQVFEVLTGEVLTYTAQLKGPVDFSFHGQAQLNGGLKFFYDKHFSDGLPAMVPHPENYLKYELSYNLFFEKTSPISKNHWTPATSAVDVLRPDISDNHLYRTTFIINWFKDGSVELRPFSNWARCGFRGINWASRKEFPNPLVQAA